MKKSVGKELKNQIIKKENRLPNSVVAWIGGGSNSLGLFYNFLDDENRIALICFILSLCALILILILMISKKIRDKYNS